MLARHRWPGNVRQLENAVFRAVVLAEGDAIGVTEFPQVAAQLMGQAPPLSPESTNVSSARTAVDVPPLLGIGPGVAPEGAPVIHGALAMLDAHGDVRPLEDMEAEAIRFAIAHYRGQMSEVARRLRIGRSTLYRKLEQIGLTDRSRSHRNEPANAN
jgi:DNA-binding NtrC family response regulator